MVRIPKEKKSIWEIFADNGSSAVLGRLVGHLREECPGAIVASRASGARVEGKEARSQLASFTTTDRMYHRYATAA